MTLKEWIDLFCEEFPSINRELVDRMPIQYKDLTEDGILKGCILYCVLPGFTGKKELMEIFFYLKQEFRNFKNANKLINMFEETGKEEGCDIIKIASNSGYRDQTIVKFLLRKGYQTDTVSKEI